jgi:hypothetical protein
MVKIYIHKIYNNHYKVCLRSDPNKSYWDKHNYNCTSFSGALALARRLEARLQHLEFWGL